MSREREEESLPYQQDARSRIFCSVYRHNQMAQLFPPTDCFTFENGMSAWIKMDPFPLFPATFSKYKVIDVDADITSCQFSLLPPQATHWCPIQAIFREGKRRKASGSRQLPFLTRSSHLTLLTHPLAHTNTAYFHPNQYQNEAVVVSLPWPSQGHSQQDAGHRRSSFPPPSCRVHACTQ